MVKHLRVVVGVVLGVGLLLAGCQREEQTKSRPVLRVLCGSSMSGPVQEIGQAFAQEWKAEVVYDLGGSETLLPKVEAGAVADVFVCHDPFEQKVKEAGKWAGTAVVGELRPVLLVRKGNPKGIGSLEDLARADLKLGIGDPRYSTCGELFVKKLQEKGIEAKVMERVVLQGRTHAEIANGIILGPLDAVVVWNFVAELYKEKLDLVETGDRYESMRVTVLGLAQSPAPELRDAFLEVCRSQRVREIFERHGYGGVAVGPTTRAGR